MEKKFDSRAHLDRIRKMPMKKLPVFLDKMLEERNQLIESGEYKNHHVYFSPVNRKGAPVSVSTIPVADCTNCAGCKLQCYDLRHDCNAKSVRHTRAINSAILAADPDRFFREINARCKSLDRFRWHVGGDVKDLYYFSQVVAIALDNPHCTFHLFTKNYKAVNEWIALHASYNPDVDQSDLLPSNLSMRFSAWPGVEMPNPNDINVCEVVFEDSFVATGADTALCTGNCTECAIRCHGCFDKSIQTVYIPVH